MVQLLLMSERVTRHKDHRGYWHTAKYLGFAARDQRAVVGAGKGCLEIDLGDPYWTRLVAPGYHYEPEVERLLMSIVDRTTDFLDVGANIGYWSVWVSQQFPECRVLALEPNPSAYQWLCQNNLRNGGRFETRPLAVGIDGRRDLPFHIPAGRGGHAGAHLAATGGSTGYTREVLVDATPLDEVLTHFRRRGRRVLAKLDIEGMEETVLASSEACGAPEVAVLYEDHGADFSCRPTRYLLSRGDQVVFFMPSSGRLVEVVSIGQLAAQKRSPKVGYNCVAAVRDSDWHKALLPLCEL
jgi:FkbM family methyltransferase